MKKLFFSLSLTLIGIFSVTADPPYCKTAEECLAGCDKKDADSCDRLSDMYQSGNKIAKDPEKAVQYKLLACEYGDAYRCLVAGWDYQYPYSDKSDLKQAEVLYQKACDKGDKRGCDFIHAMKEGRVAKPEKDDPRPPQPPLLCSDAKSTKSPANDDTARNKVFNNFEIEEPAKLLKRVDPKYPAEERHKGQEGKVFLEVVVGEHGEISSGKVLKAPSLSFARAAEDAVKQWQYSPPRHCGKAVSVYKNVTMVFTLH